jgi:hypothetical protein
VMTRPQHDPREPDRGPLERHKAPFAGSFGARPRGFEPLTFGSVALRGRAVAIVRGG